MNKLKKIEKKYGKDYGARNFNYLRKKGYGNLYDLLNKSK